MDSIFSHSEAGEPAGETRTPPGALTAQVTVFRGPNDAFAGFTDGIHLWWPVEQTHFGEGTHPEFTEGEMFEEDASGRSFLWATVQRPPAHVGLLLAWHHQGNPNLSSQVSLSFAPEDAGTRVELVHDGWADGDLGHEQFAAAPDWLAALSSFQRFMGGAS